MKREFRPISVVSEVTVIRPNLILVKAEEGWAITHSDKQLAFENDTMYFPNCDCLDKYICVKKVQLETEE